VYSVIILFHLKNTTADILINIKKAVIHKHFIVPARKLLGIRDSIKSSIKGGVAGVHYSKLAMDEAEEDAAMRRFYLLLTGTIVQILAPKRALCCW
jgi:hypothetical protein